MKAGKTSGLAGLLLNVGLVVLATAFTFVLLEVCIRLFVDTRLQRPIRIDDVNLETRLSFLPNRSRVYETSEFKVEVSTNSFGRRDVEWTPETLADPENILFIGDSFVFGNGVAEESAIPSQIEEHFASAGQRVEVLNFGMPAAAIAQYQLNLEEALRLGIAARRVLVGVFVGNDFDPNALPPRDAENGGAKGDQLEEKPRGPSLLDHSQLVQFVKWRIAQSQRLVGVMLDLSRLTGVRLYTTPAAYIFFREQTPEQIEAFNRMLGYLGSMKEICDANGRELRVVVFPNKIQVENHDDLSSESYEAEKPNRLIREYCAELGIRCLDLFPVLSAAYAQDGQSLYFPIDRHLNVRGASLAASAIYEFLARAPEKGPT